MLLCNIDFKHFLSVKLLSCLSCASLLFHFRNSAHVARRRAPVVGKTCNREWIKATQHQCWHIGGKAELTQALLCFDADLVSTRNKK
jgi:hypothetical protein